MTAAVEGGEWSAARLGRTLPPRKNRYPLFRRLGGSQGRSGRTENLVPTGIRSRTLQPVVQSLCRLSYRAQKDVIGMKYMRNGRFVNKTYRTSNIILWRNLLRAVSKLGPLISQRYLAKISNANLFFCDNRQGELFTEVLSPVR